TFMRQNLTLRYICTHGTPFLWRSLPRALQRDESHASGRAAWIAVITSSEPPHSTKHEGKGAGCPTFPNLRLPFKKKTLAESAISRCQYAVSVRAGSKPTINLALPCSTSAFAFAVHRERLLLYGGFINTRSNQRSDNPSSSSV